MKGEWGGIVISLSTLQLTCCGKYSCFLCGTVRKRLLWKCGMTRGLQKSCNKIIAFSLIIGGFGLNVVKQQGK